MFKLTFEVFSRFQAATDANKLLYTPIADKLTYNHTRYYTAECEGDEGAARDYLRRVLVDPISQKVQEDDTPALTGSSSASPTVSKRERWTWRRKPFLPTMPGEKDCPSP